MNWYYDNMICREKQRKAICIQNREMSNSMKGSHIDVVPNGKLLGLTIFKDLKGNAHVSDIARRVASRLYLLRQRSPRYWERASVLLHNLHPPGH